MAFWLGEAGVGAQRIVTVARMKEDNKSIPWGLAALIRRLSPVRRRRIVPLLVLMFVGAIAELVTIGAAFPFLGLVANPNGTEAISMLGFESNIFGSNNTETAIVFLAGLFALAAVLAASIRLLLLYQSQKFVYGVSCEIAIALYSNALYQSYAYHTQNNSSEIIAGIQKVQQVTNGILMPIMQAAIAVVIASFIVAGLIIIDPVVAIATAVGLAATYVPITLVIKARLKQNSGTMARAQNRRVQVMREGLGGIRDVLLDHSQAEFVRSYEVSESAYRDARTTNQFLAGAPRFVSEAGGMLLIAALVVIVSFRPSGLVNAIPTLGVLALGAQRLLPLVQQIYSGWAQALGNRQNLVELAESLSRATPEARKNLHVNQTLRFDTAIELNSVSYSYPSNRTPAISDLVLTIPKGARVGIVGETASGKSTLMDLVIGLLEPTHGAILIDGALLTNENREAWRSSIGHVPQDVYLADATITENIAFGLPRLEIDMERVRRAALQAELMDTITSLQGKFEARIGERGTQLSGGQRQRVGIARALYKEATVLVLDEATSALDTTTETSVMAAIERLSKEITIFIIAHRRSTLKICDMIIHLSHGKLTKVERKETK